MFARAALVGRVARERQEANRRYYAPPVEKVKEPEAPLRQRCFLPCLRRSWLAVGFGCFLILLGAVMCYFAYKAQALATPPSSPMPERVHTEKNHTQFNGTREGKPDRSTYLALRSLSYIGPGIMGIGVFIIILACVLLLDRRDKILQEWALLFFDQVWDYPEGLRTNKYFNLPKAKEEIERTNMQQNISKQLSLRAHLVRDDGVPENKPITNKGFTSEQPSSDMTVNSNNTAEEGTISNGKESTLESAMSCVQRDNKQPHTDRQWSASDASSTDKLITLRILNGAHPMRVAHNDNLQDEVALLNRLADLDSSSSISCEYYTNQIKILVDDCEN